MSTLVSSAFDNICDCHTTIVPVVEVKKSYYLASDFMKLLGSDEDWNANDEKFKLLDVGNGIHVITVVLPEGGYEFKITAGTWDENYGIKVPPHVYNETFVLSLKSAVTIYFNDEDKSIGFFVVAV
jgi:hypothetical protein